MKKFEFTGETKQVELLFRTATLHRIKAVAEFGIVKVGDLGGLIQKKKIFSMNKKGLNFGAMPEVCGDAKVWGIC